MPLKAPSVTIGGVDHGVVPERFLSYGPEYSGKTQCWLSVALLAQQVGGDETFWVADSDSGVLRSMSRDFTELTNVSLTNVIDFNDYKKWARGLRDVVRPGDWVVSDTASTAYEKAQGLFFKMKYGVTRQELEFERMFDSTRKAGSPLIEPDEWVAIRDAFLNWWEIDIVAELSLRRSCHVFATAEAKQIFDHFENPRKDGHKKDKSAWLDYGDLGFRPDGHKSLPHKVSTVFFMKRGYDSAKDESAWWLTPTKDRQRVLKPLKLENGFAVDYLLGRAGWVVE